LAFDFERFFEQNGISFATSGSNVSRGNVAIHCPFCGSADEGQHMSVNLHGQGFRCFRRPDHRGKNPARLVQAILGCTWERAQALLMTKRYNLRYATQGPYKRRVIFPITFEGKLVSWTGRAIDKGTEIRYKTLSADPERATREGCGQALGPITDYLLWYDRVMSADADTLIICEGPFDACKVDVLGRREGIVATCVFTSRPTNRQIELLHTMLPRFKRKYLLLDRGTLPTQLAVQGELVGLGLQLAELPRGLKDPGQFVDRQQLRQMFVDNTC
jgi:hypothetical protein